MRSWDEEPRTGNGPGPDGARSVLVVEDDRDHALLIRLAFERSDPPVQIGLVPCAEDAITLLRAGESFHAIVLDINMPGIGGLGFLEWYAFALLSSLPPVVVYSSSGDPGLRDQCLAMGATRFVQKSADFGELVPVVDAVIAAGTD